MSFAKLPRIVAVGIIFQLVSSRIPPPPNVMITPTPIAGLPYHYLKARANQPGPGEIGIDPVDPPPITKWIGVDTAYLTQGPNAPSTTTKLKQVTATVAGPGIDIGDVGIQLSDDTTKELKEIYDKTCGKAGARKEKRSGTVTQCMIDFAQEATAEGGPLDIPDSKFSVPTFSSSDIAAAVAFAKRPDVLLAFGFAIAYGIEMVNKKGEAPNPVAIDHSATMTGPYTTSPVPSSASSGNAGPNGAMTVDVTYATSACTSTIKTCHYNFGCPGNGGGTCGVNTVSCADYRVNCETEFAKTATMIWPEPDHVEDFAAWKKAGDAAVADEKKYYEGKGGGGDSEPSGGDKRCYGTNTNTFADRDPASKNAESFCNDPNNLKADNNDNRVSVWYGSEHPDGSGKVTDENYMELVITYKSKDSKRIDDKWCKNGFGAAIDGCDTDTSQKHGADFFNDDVTLAFVPHMQRVKFFDDGKGNTQCNKDHDGRIYSNWNTMQNDIENYCDDTEKAWNGDSKNYPRAGDDLWNDNNKIWHPDTPEALQFGYAFKGNGGKAYRFWKDECVRYLRIIAHDCPVIPNTDAPWRNGGVRVQDGVEWSIKPLWVRQPAITDRKAVCATWYTGRGSKWEVHGAGYMLDDFGQSSGGLLDWTNHDAGTEFHFEYSASTTDEPKGMDWRAYGMYRINVDPDSFIRNAVKQAGGGGPEDCTQGNKDWPWVGTPIWRRDLEGRDDIDFNTTQVGAGI